MSVFKTNRSPYWHYEFVIQGQRFQGSTRCLARREAVAAEKRIRADALRQQGRVSQQQTETLDRAFGRYWLEIGSKQKSRRSIATYSTQILDYFGTELLLSDLHSREVAGCVQCWRANGDGPANINRRISLLRRVLRVAGEQWGLATNQIAWREFKQKEPQHRTRWATPEEARKLIAACPPHIRLAVEWSFHTGCRFGETESLRWDHVFTDRGYCEVTGKTGTRWVWLSIEAHKVLARCERTSTKVFDLRGYRKTFNKARVVAGMPDFRWHDCRHTFATWMRQAGTPIEIVQRALGHKAITTTTRYAHVEDREVVRAVGGLPSLSETPENIIRLRKET